MKKKDRNTTRVPQSLHFGDIMHMDIVFGPDIAIGNIHYGLLFTDRFSRMTCLYHLQNLTMDIKKQRKHSLLVLDLFKNDIFLTLT
jgi:hypothetical protein